MKYKIKDKSCVNSNFTARFLASSGEEHCQCSFGGCKVRVEVEINGNPPHVYILTEEEIEESPLFKGTREQLDNLTC